MNNKVKKAEKIAMEEKIVNDFLLQFAYSIFSAMLLMYIYNGRMFKYGADICLAMPKVIWVLFGIFAVLGIVFLVLNKTKNNNGYKIASIYSFISAAGMFWCIGFETIFDLLHLSVPFYSAQRAMISLFIIIGIATVVEFVMYFVRSAKLKK